MLKLRVAMVGLMALAIGAPAAATSYMAINTFRDTTPADCAVMRAAIEQRLTSPDAAADKLAHWTYEWSANDGAIGESAEGLQSALPRLAPAKITLALERLEERILRHDFTVVACDWGPSRPGWLREFDRNTAPSGEIYFNVRRPLAGGYSSGLDVTSPRTIVSLPLEIGRGEALVWLSRIKDGQGYTDVCWMKRSWGRWRVAACGETWRSVERSAP